MMHNSMRAGQACDHCGQGVTEWLGLRRCHDGVERDFVRCPRCKATVLREPDPPEKVVDQRLGLDDCCAREKGQGHA